ncbi:hypothetical protein BJ741DRAFT_606478 [Chytriomyces cf. hyalinus JEL632]|nr:hypothetical protein BJ741DRAFT_606478 [Chytriomyces cf. hyalinus JEL632]
MVAGWRQQLSIFGHAVLAALMLSSVLAVLAAIILAELPQAKKPVTLRNIFANKVNNLLLLCNLFGCFNASINAIYAVMETERPMCQLLNTQDSNGTLLYVFYWLTLGAAAEPAYILFSWSRGEAILRQQAHGTVFKVAKFSTKLIPILASSPVLLIFLPHEWTPATRVYIYVVVLFLSHTLLIILDLLLAFCFTMYIRKNFLNDTEPKAEGRSFLSKYFPSNRSALGGKQESDQHAKSGLKELRRFKIIANYGLVSASSGLTTLTLILIALICLLLDPELEQDNYAEIYHIVWGLKDVTLTWIVLGCCGMKVALTVARVEEEKASILALRTGTAEAKSQEMRRPQTSDMSEAALGSCI